MSRKPMTNSTVASALSEAFTCTSGCAAANNMSGRILLRRRRCQVLRRILRFELQQLLVQPFALALARGVVHAANLACFVDGHREVLVSLAIQLQVHPQGDPLRVVEI